MGMGIQELKGSASKPSNDNHMPGTSRVSELNLARSPRGRMHELTAQTKEQQSRLKTAQDRSA